MNNMQKSFFLTTTLPYVNAPLHMGHALEFVRADTIARYKKLLGYDVYFNTGTDEHGLKIFEKAKENGLTAQEFVDQGFEVFKEQLKMFGVIEDIHFIRTTDKTHEISAGEFWNRVKNNGYIYKKTYEAKYCVGCESEKTDSELVDGFCPSHPGIPLKLINEENYFFKYSSFTERLLDFYEKNPNFIIPEFRFHEIKNFVKNGLQDFSISRLKEKMSWGIPVPGDDTQVMYVWFDALVNYISTLGWPASAIASAGKPDEDLFTKYWINGTPTQYCGKDNTRFQGAMWQAMLMAAGVPNSHQIIVNGFITGDGGIRMSKTIGNVVDPRDIVKEYGTDALRYFLLREVSSFEDSPFTMERFKDAYNSGLANGLGNLTSRILTMSSNNEVVISEKDIEENKNNFQMATFSFLDSFDIKMAMESIWMMISILDLTIQNEQPFKLIKTDPEKAKKIIRHCLIGLFWVSKHIEPMLPETSQKIQKLIRENKKPEQPLFLRKE
jgi:methionyl-tRNA synthetase